MNEYFGLLLWLVLIGVLFAAAWYKGYIKRLADFVSATREELRKCTWPTIEELKGSTAVVIVSIILLGAFTVGVDLIVTTLVRMVT